MPSIRKPGFILIRLPNWLGDIVMSLSFLENVKKEFPSAKINIIVKKEYASLLDYITGINDVFAFEKKKFSGFTGLRKFGKSLRKINSPDLFISLPDSISSAIIGYYSGAKTRIGFRGQWRRIFFTRSFKKPSGMHRTEEYNYLLAGFLNKELFPAPVHLNKKSNENIITTHRILLNINSEASSRRMPSALANSILSQLLIQTSAEIILTGGPRDVEHVNTLDENLLNNSRVHNYAGKTTLPELFELISAMDRVISTDSGIAHVASAFNVPSIVLFGAGDESNTAPVNPGITQIIRLPGLPCAPCLKNTCRFGTPLCLSRLDAEEIVGLLYKSP